MAGDEILYRDESYFNQLKSGSQPSQSFLGSESHEPAIQNSIEQQKEMGAPLEEHKDTGPLVACKVWQKA